MRIFLLGIVMGLNILNALPSESDSKLHDKETQSTIWISPLQTVINSEVMVMDEENVHSSLIFHVTNNFSGNLFCPDTLIIKSSCLKELHYCWNLSMLSDFSPPGLS